MNKIKELRGAATHNGAKDHKKRITWHRLKNKLHNAILYGTVAGALIGVVIGGIMIDADPLRGFLTALPGVGWLYLFFAVNSDDQLFGDKYGAGSGAAG